MSVDAHTDEAGTMPFGISVETVMDEAVNAPRLSCWPVKFTRESTYRTEVETVEAVVVRVQIVEAVREEPVAVEKARVLAWNVGGVKRLVEMAAAVRTVVETEAVESVVAVRLEMDAAAPCMFVVFRVPKVVTEGKAMTATPTRRVPTTPTLPPMPDRDCMVPEVVERVERVTAVSMTATLVDTAGWLIVEAVMVVNWAVCV